jgi:hypothetical protein
MLKIRNLVSKERKINMNKCSVGGGVLALSNPKCYIILYKNEGKFYLAKGIDAYILNVLLNYKVINNKAGFPDNALSKVLNEIENCKINYQIIYENSNPIIKDFKKLNNYEVYAEKAKNAIQINENIKILEEKIKKANDAELKKILEYINGLIL